MLPDPNSEAFSIMAVAFEPGFDMAKARWSYEILYSVGARLEAALERLTQTQFHLKEEAGKTAAMRKNKFATAKSLAAHEKGEARRIKALFKRIDPALQILDRLSEKIGAERHHVNEEILNHFYAADKNGKIKMVNDIWKAANNVWGKPGFYDTTQGKQLRMLRVLQRSQLVEPLLEPWFEMLKVTDDMREYCSK